MNALIYLEGGAKGSKDLTVRCREAFNKLLKRMGFNNHMPRLVACGARDDVYEKFCIAHRSSPGFIAMWIDSEEPMADIEKAWDHLANVHTVAKWEKPPGANDDQVLFMTTCMETLIVADRAALSRVFGQKLKENSLPSHTQLEGRSREVIQKALETATSPCATPYAKGKRSFEVLEQLNPEILKKHLPSFVRVERILKAKL